jgi:hypothetical protein
MDREIAKLWAAELRSGKYVKLRLEMGVHGSETQVRRKNNERCCLGVLREILLERDPTMAKSIHSESLLSGLEIRAAGMHPDRGATGVFPDGLWLNGEGSLSRVNDYTEATFLEIAGVIDAYWRDL